MGRQQDAAVGAGVADTLQNLRCVLLLVSFCQRGRCGAARVYDGLGIWPTFDYFTSTGFVAASISVSARACHDE